MNGFVNRKKILIVDDSQIYTQYVGKVLSAEGYQTVFAYGGKQALQKVESEKPDLMLLDVLMPDLSGYEVCRILRASESNALMPIVMFSSQTGLEAKITGLDLGADDYVAKPFDNRELLCRVKNLLTRIDHIRSLNPITTLPGSMEIQHEISRRIRTNDPYAVIYADIDNFKIYNHMHGLKTGDEVIRTTADIITNGVEDCGIKEGFIGHSGGDDFFLITTPDFADAVCKNVIGEFDRLTKGFHSEDEIQNGRVVLKNRCGADVEYPLLSLTMSIVTNTLRSFESYVQIDDVAREVAMHIKLLPGSNYAIDRRRS